MAARRLNAPESVEKTGEMEVSINGDTYGWLVMENAMKMG